MGELRGDRGAWSRPRYRFVPRQGNNAGCVWLVLGFCFAPLWIVAMVTSRPGSLVRGLSIFLFVMWSLLVFGMLFCFATLGWP